MIKIMNGDIFESEAECLVNPVNCVGVMGKGLALEFKRRYPDYFVAYKEICDNLNLKSGIFAFHGFKNKYGKDFISFPTKYHWSEQSDLSSIAASLRLFSERYFDFPDQSYAFPALGCGLGGLEWNDVFKIMKIYLEPLPIICEIYPPKEKVNEK